MATTLFGTPFHPNLWTPGWILEGITVYAESSLSPYEGRLNDGYFASYLKTRAKEGKFPSLNTMTHSPFEYPYGEGYYLYGGQFFQYLSMRYGEDKFFQFFSHIGGSIFSYLAPLFSRQTLLCSGISKKDRDIRIEGDKLYYGVF